MVLNMTSGTISGNTALGNGGGIAVGTGSYMGIFNMTGGTIYGNSESDTLKNTAAADGGASLYKGPSATSTYPTSDATLAP
jgi:predicted outer membrane repeat protein